MLVHIVTRANLHLYAGQIQQMYRQRAAASVDRVDWPERDSGGEFERDAYDTEHAVYLLLLGDVGEVHGSIRLLPTWRQHGLAKAIGESVTQPELAAGPNVWEVTRYVSSQGCGAEFDQIARAYLLTAMAEFALSRGVDAYVSRAELPVLTLLGELGWSTTVIGEPRDLPHAKVVAVRFAIGEAELKSTRALFGLSRAASIELPALPDHRVIDPALHSVAQAIFDLEDHDRINELLFFASRVLTEDRMAAAARLQDGPSLLRLRTLGNA